MARDFQAARKQDTALSFTPKIFISAGEVSGDDHGARLLRALKTKVGIVECLGMGGHELRKEGMRTLVDSESMAMMGLTEIVGKLSHIAKNFKILVQALETEKPHLLVIIDFPDFNMRLAREAKRRGIPVVYFIPPQIWAWRTGRVKKIRSGVDKVFSIFPFEEQFYRKHKVDAEFVGHPTAWEWEKNLSVGELKERFGFDSTARVVALLPGSRLQEVKRLLPVMIEAFEKLVTIRPGLQAIIPVASGIGMSRMREILGREVPGLHLVDGQARDVMRVADATIVASGTATVEALLAKRPFVVIYKLSTITYYIARILVRGVRYFAMPNLIAGEKIVEELLQDEVTADRVAAEVERFLGDPKLTANLEARLTKTCERLEAGRSPVEAVATGIVEILSRAGS